MKHQTLGRFALTFFACATMSACGKAADHASVPNSVNVRTNETAIDSTVDGMRVVRSDKLNQQLNGTTLLSAANGDASRYLKNSKNADERAVYAGVFPTADVTISTPESSGKGLVVGLPIGDLGEERVLGGVITVVSAYTNADLGGLKLADFPMLHGKLMLANLSTNAPQLLLVGCANKCEESSPRAPLIAFPISAVDTLNRLLMIDLSAVGKDLDFMKLADPKGEATGLKSTGSVATSFDSSDQTILFDIDSKMVAVDPTHPLPDTTITMRWFLKSSAAFDSAFTSRDSSAGVGFFMTDNAAKEKIKRWSLAAYGTAGIKYYLKHIPAEWQPAFASAFDQWNETFTKNMGHKIFDYEFIPENDPRNDLLVPGDVRYNIVEWDLKNLATYGGLGPCVSNQYSGQTISANVLIQGPTIIKLYTDWYKVGIQAKALSDAGNEDAAQAMLAEFSRAQDAQMKESGIVTMSIGRNKNLKLTVHSAKPELADPYAQRNDFDELPPNVDYKTYMNGYFHDMLTHELGHNLGLRHNFRGNMGAIDTGTKGSTSRSVMEYLGRKFRYLDQVGEYDIMALQYGYQGKKPAHTDWYCTDEDKWTKPGAGANAECSADDATSDPYSFFEARLTRALDLLDARGSTQAPTWKQDDLVRELNIAINGLVSYAATDEATAKTYTNFYGKPGRPAAGTSAQTFVVARVKQTLCDPALEQVILAKIDAAAQTTTRTAITALRETTIKAFTKAGVNLGFDTSCAQVPAAPLASFFE